MIADDDDDDDSNNNDTLSPFPRGLSLTVPSNTHPAAGGPIE